MSDEISTTTVSAPGKILLAGGYVVLEKPNVGVVLAVDKRFYSTVVKQQAADTNGESEPETKKSETEETSVATIITVHSPQFGATWKYQAQKNADGALELSPDASNATSNTFVEKSLRITLAYTFQKEPLSSYSSLEITILADNDFYSVTPHLQKRNWEATAENLAKLPKFLPCQLSSGGSLQKTGLGSSAALVTSLVGALVLSSTKSDDNKNKNNNKNNNEHKPMDDTTRRRIHN